MKHNKEIAIDLVPIQNLDPFLITVEDENGCVVFTKIAQTTLEKQLTIDTTNWHGGIYLFSAIKGNEILYETLIYKSSRTTLLLTVFLPLAICS